MLGYTTLVQVVISGCEYVILLWLVLYAGHADCGDASTALPTYHGSSV